MNLIDLTLTQALAGVRSGKFKSVDLVSSALENIAKYNKIYNVFLTVEDEKELLSQAKIADESDKSLPLVGMPIALKDLFSTKNLRTTAGANVLKKYRPVYDATVVRKLKQAGAIIVGKLNQDAWAHGSTGENSDFGPTANAYNLSHVAGGSSSGSATAVALGMSLAATATDTGGSIRAPGAFSNLVGFKPTYGRVSRYGIIAMASSLDSIGHLTKSVADSALILSVTAGTDPYDATTGTAEVPNYQDLLKRTDLKGVKVGVSPEYIAIGAKATHGMDPKLEEKVEEALNKIRSLGAEIVEVSLPYTKAALEAYYIICPSEVSSNLARYDGIRFGQGRDQFGAEAKRRMMIGAYSLSSGYYDAYYKTAQKIRSLVSQDFAKAFKEVDVVFAPVTPMMPPKIGENINDPMALYLVDIFTVPVNLAGVPALSLPAGFVDGLPVGIQLIGPHWSEQKLFEIANVYEQATEWFKTKPKIANKT